MKLIIPQKDFNLRTESDRIIIDTSLPDTDRRLERSEIAKRLNRSLRMVDFYRHLTGEARLGSERFKNRIVIRESEFNRWHKFITTEGNDRGNFGRIRSRKGGRRRLEEPRGNLQSVPITQSSARPC